MTLRILHVLDHSIPKHSGYAFRTLSILREQRKLGWETFHLTTPKHVGSASAEEDIDGWHFFRTAGRAHGSGIPVIGELMLMRQVERRLDKVVRLVNPDVLHAHSPVLNAIPALRVGRRLRLPVVYEVRAFWEDAAVDHGTTREDSPRYRLTRSIETYAMRRADHVTVICEGLRRDIIARGIPSSKVTVIPNAVDTKSFSPGGVADAALKAELGLASATVIGFIGSLYAYEGLDLLIQALPRIAVSVPDVRVVLVGGGPQQSELKEQVARLGLDGKVVFAGNVPHENVQKYYDLIDVLVYPRHSMRLTELVTPLKPLEAMAQGRVLVASDVGGHRELIKDAVNGVLFRSGDADSLASAVVGLLSNREHWPALRAAGRRFVETERNWTKSVSHYRSVYASLDGCGGAAFAT
jgi:PEP-CTERM/exosortase A-associated glycosyltransferase